MQLPVAELEEALRFAVGVVLQTLRTKDRVFEGDSDWRSGGTHSFAHFWSGVFGARKRREAPAGILLEKLRPAFEALASTGDKYRCFSMNVGNGIELVNGLVLQGRLLCRQFDHPPRNGIKALHDAGKSRNGLRESFDRHSRRAPPECGRLALEPSAGMTVLAASAASRALDECRGCGDQSVMFWSGRLSGYRKPHHADGRPASATREIT